MNICRQVRKTPVFFNVYFRKIVKKKANSNCICEIWMKIKGKLQYRIFKMMNKCVMSN